MPKKKYVTRFRDDEGVFIKKEKAEKLPKRDYTKESVPLPGYGDTGRKSSKKRA